MTKNGTPPEKLVCLREDWPHILAHHCQAVAGEAACTDVLMVRLLTERFLYSLPRPANPVERLFLRQQLMEFSLRWGTEIHQDFHKEGSKGDCRFSPAGLVLEVWHDRSTDPIELFTRWSIRLVDDFERSHVSALASHVRKYIDAHFADRDIKGLAKALRCTQAHATAEFRKAFGVSASQYQRRLRVWEGLRLLRATDAKVESVARTVGYRSKKNFYQVTRDETGRTPMEIRTKRNI